MIKNRILSKVCIHYNIDISEEYVEEMLDEAYLNEININEDFLKRIGIHVGGLVERIGERYLKKRKFYNEIKEYIPGSERSGSV